MRCYCLKSAKTTFKRETLVFCSLLSNILPNMPKSPFVALRLWGLSRWSMKQQDTSGFEKSWPLLPSLRSS